MNMLTLLVGVIALLLGYSAGITRTRKEWSEANRRAFAMACLKVED